MQRRQILAGLAAVAASPALAQARWSPDRPIRVIVPFAPGGSTDITARLVAEAISPRLGQPVVIENRPGAAGNIGSEAVARAAPDGYTLVMATSSTHATNGALYRNMPFDAQRDFAPISQTTFIPNLLVVHPDVPARDFAGLVAEAKAKPGVLNFGNAGSLRAIAVTTARRSALLPDVPTSAETLPGFEVALWNGYMAPASTPAPIVNRIAAEIRAVMRTDDMRAKLAQQGSEPVGSTPEEFRAFLASEIPKWAELVRISGAKVE